MLCVNRCTININIVCGFVEFGGIACVVVAVGAAAPVMACRGQFQADDCGTIFADGPGSKWNVYFVKY